MTTNDSEDPIIIVTVDPNTGVTTVTIPALHSQTGKPTVITFDPNVTEAAIRSIIWAIVKT